MNSAPPSLAIISNSAFSVVNFRKNLIQDMIARGWEVYVLAPDFNHKFEEELRVIGAIPMDIKMARTGINPAGDIFSIFSLIAVLKSIAPDVTFSYGIKPVIYGLIASERAGIAYRYAMIAGLGLVYVKSKGISLRRRILKQMANRMYKFSLRYADKVFFQNYGDIDFLISRKIVSKEKVIKINGSGVDLNEFELSSKENEEVTFVLVSRLIREKGIYEYIEAARAIRTRYPGVQFILLGDRDLNPRSVESADLKQWVDEGIVAWPGHVDDVRPWLKKASVFVLPTFYREGIPKSILEAMAMGKPVITTNIPGCTEAVSNGENGFLIKPKDIDELTEAMEYFVTNPKAIRKMGLNSRIRAEKYFDVTDVNRIIIDSIEINSGLNNYNSR